MLGEGLLTGGLIPLPSKYASTNSSATQSFSTEPISLNIRERGRDGLPEGATSIISSGVPFDRTVVGKSDFNFLRGD
jgi:hypothetical protein